MRVEIISNASANYTLTQSYKKEYGALNYHYLYEDLDSINKSNKTAESGTANSDNSTMVNEPLTSPHDDLPTIDAENKSSLAIEVSNLNYITAGFLCSL